MMIARATGLVVIPEALTSEAAAPLLCAGIATFNALIKSGARPGDTVAIQGIGGLGHLALQYAKKMGFRVVAVGRGDDIAQDVKELGAHIYLDTRKVKIPYGPDHAIMTNMMIGILSNCLSQFTCIQRADAGENGLRDKSI